MADFDIALLRTFASVADSGGFSRAGERVHRTQSTISQQIKKLEDQAGRQLLQRSARAVQLTPDGERMLGYARRILSLHDEARNLFVEDLPELVRIGVTEDLGVETLPGVLEPLVAGNRHLRLEVRCGLSVHVANDLGAGLLDIGMFRTLDAANFGMPDSWEEEVFWVAPERFRPEQNAVLNLVLFPHGCVFRGHTLSQLDAQGRPWRIAYTSPNVTGIVAAVQSGMGVSLLSRRMMRGASGLRVLGESDGFSKVPAAAVVLRTESGPLSAGAQEALQRLRGFMNEAPWQC